MERQRFLSGTAGGREGVSAFRRVGVSECGRKGDAGDTRVPPPHFLHERIAQLKRERNAVILAHTYQRGEVQDVADYVGDSLGLSRQAAETDADVIIFCGVYFMAESAAIINPARTVLIPEPEAGCPLADMITAGQLRGWQKEYPGRPVVTYINSTAEVKAQSDICCTSANALAVVESIEAEELLFCPDRNLGSYVQAHTAKRLILWPGYCATHAWVTEGDVLESIRQHPRAVVLAHPECNGEVLQHADHVCSTTGMITYARQSTATEFIIVTEAGILHRLKHENPAKRFYLGSKRLLCPRMKLTTLASVVSSLETMSHVVKVEEGIRGRANEALRKMLAIA